MAESSEDDKDFDSAESSPIVFAIVSTCWSFTAGVGTKEVKVMLFFSTDSSEGGLRLGSLASFGSKPSWTKEDPTLGSLVSLGDLSCPMLLGVKPPLSKLAKACGVVRTSELIEVSLRNGV